jgi:hypothetical protein
MSFVDAGMKWVSLDVSSKRRLVAQVITWLDLTILPPGLNQGHVVDNTTPARAISRAFGQ